MHNETFKTFVSFIISHKIPPSPIEYTIRQKSNIHKQPLEDKHYKQSKIVDFY